MQQTTKQPRTREPSTHRARVEWLSRAVSALNENPDVQTRLTDALRRDDPKMFGRVLSDHWQKYGLEPPADQCDPYVTAYVFVLQQPEIVQVCTWVGPVAISTGSSTPTLSFTGTSQALLQWLIAQGLVQCTWVVKNQGAELQVVKKFVQGICPPGTF